MLEDNNARNGMKSRSKSKQRVKIFWSLIINSNTITLNCLDRFKKSTLFASDSDDSDENTLFDANNAVNRAKSIGNGIHNRKLNGGLKSNKTEKV